MFRFVALCVVRCGLSSCVDLCVASICVAFGCVLFVVLCRLTLICVAFGCFVCFVVVCRLALRLVALCVVRCGLSSCVDLCDASICVAFRCC